ncbi:hypothetical protein SAMN04487944_12166 [Gracilibacillus ureilyticus]|uniref:Uncharacterized protein n=1 Tax=Gracilibacillus ureilyticus TaxID=531814 RepID=A0A1H9V5V9_9BACI|nr:hypothetical protein [Gracilibacillus ureilyticus]SES16949.1 hypothetical protein SAMN04487944_12166 [Gracilibacillus ureilyticus]
MHAAAEIAYHLRIVQGLAEQVLDRMPVWENTMEERYVLLLQEKKESIQIILDELMENPVMNEEIHKNLNIVYKGDEAGKLLFEQWKRVAEQNNYVNKDELNQLEDNFEEMKTELTKAVTPLYEFAGGWEKTRFIVPALYRD